MKKIAYTLTVLSLSIASVAFANSDDKNVNPAGAIGAYTPDDQFAGACPKCFSQAKTGGDKIAQYQDLLAGEAGGPKTETKATDAADGEKQ